MRRTALIISLFACLALLFLGGVGLISAWAGLDRSLVLTGARDVAITRLGLARVRLSYALAPARHPIFGA